MLNVGKTVAHPWMCDVLGHMTTRFYTGMFDDASYHFLFDVFGFNGATDDAGEFGWVDASHTTGFVSEVNAGDILDIRVVLEKVGTKSITARYQMHNLGSGDLAATLAVTYVFFDMQQRCSAVIPDALREMALKYLEG